MYNIEVLDNHTYFVGDKAILVHNQCKDVQGGGHGKSQKHKDTIDDWINDMAKNGHNSNGVNIDYDSIYGNRALSTAGLTGSQRPDIITVRQENGITIYDIYEFASPSQSNGTSAYRDLVNKINDMRVNNPDTSERILNFFLFDWGKY